MTRTAAEGNFTQIIHNVSLLQDYHCPTAVELALSNPDKNIEDWDETLARIHNIGIRSCGWALSLVPDLIDDQYTAQLKQEEIDRINVAIEVTKGIANDDPAFYAEHIIVDDAKKDKFIRSVGSNLIHLAKEMGPSELRVHVVENASLLKSTKHLNESFPELVKIYGLTEFDLRLLTDIQLERIQGRALKLDPDLPDFTESLGYLFNSELIYNRVQTVADKYKIRPRRLDINIVRAVKILEINGLKNRYEVLRVAALYDCIDKDSQRLRDIVRLIPDYFTNFRLNKHILSETGRLTDEQIEEYESNYQRLNAHSQDDVNAFNKIYEQPSIDGSDDENMALVACVAENISEIKLGLSDEKIEELVLRYPSILKVSQATLTVRLRALKKTFGPQLSGLILEDHFEYLAANPIQGIGSIIEDLPITEAQRQQLTKNNKIGHASYANKQIRLQNRDEQVAAFDNNPDDQAKADDIKTILASYGIDVDLRAMLHNYPNFLEYDNEKLLRIRAIGLRDLVGVEEATNLIARYPGYLVIQRPIQAFEDGLSGSNELKLRKRLHKMNNANQSVNFDSTNIAST